MISVKVRLLENSKDKTINNSLKKNKYVAEWELKINPGFSWFFIKVYKMQKYKINFNSDHITTF